METWHYKLTDKKLELSGVVVLTNRGFVCRSAHDEKTRAWPANVQHVAVGDTLNLYFVKTGKTGHPVGAFEVIAREQHPKPERFGDPVEGSALYLVEDDAFIRDVMDATPGVEPAYKPDVVLGKFTGWLVRRVGPAPAYDAKIFPSQGSLVKG